MQSWIRLERPERPIPSGLVSKKAATIFGGVFFFIGIFAAGLYNPNSQLSCRCHHGILPDL